MLQYSYESELISRTFELIADGIKKYANSFLPRDELIDSISL